MAEVPEIPDEQTFDRWITGEVDAALGRLPTTGAAVLRMLFGIDGGEPMSAEEVGVALGLDAQEVRRIRTESLAALRANGNSRA